MSWLHQRGREVVVPRRGRDHRPDMGSSYRNEDRELLEDLAKDLEYLTTNIDAPHIDDLPRWTRRHVAGVGEWFGRLLRKVARSVACYHDSHAPRD